MNIMMHRDGCEMFYIMQATIFGVPIYPWLLWGTIATLSFAALVLFQTGVYNFFYF